MERLTDRLFELCRLLDSITREETDMRDVIDFEKMQEGIGDEVWNVIARARSRWDAMKTEKVA